MAMVHPHQTSVLGYVINGKQREGAPLVTRAVTTILVAILLQGLLQQLAVGAVPVTITPTTPPQLQTRTTAAPKSFSSTCPRSSNQLS